LVAAAQRCSSSGGGAYNSARTGRAAAWLRWTTPGE